jgi:hypothetical protein
MLIKKTEQIVETECDGLLSLKMIKNDFICFYVLTESVGRFLSFKNDISTFLMSQDTTICHEQYNSLKVIILAGRLFLDNT